MNKFLKFCLVTAVILILAGLILGVASTVAGGGREVARMAENGELTFDGDYFDFPFLNTTLGFQDTLHIDFDDVKPLYDLDDVEIFNGGKEVLSGNISRMELEADKITDFEISMGGGEFSIKNSGDEKFYLEAQNAEKLQVYTDDETLHLKAIRTKANDINMNVILYIPKDLEYDEMKLELGAGIFKLDEAIEVEDFEGEVGAGQMLVENLICDNLKVSVGAGEFLSSNLVVKKEAKWEIGAGHIQVKGCLEGDLDVECSMGSVEFELQGKEEDFNYEIECLAGTVQIDDDKFSGVSEKRAISNGAAQEMNLECAMGEIEIDFTK